MYLTHARGNTHTRALERKMKTYPMFSVGKHGPVFKEFQHVELV